MSINWQATVALLDAAPGIDSKNGTAVLAALVAAGRQYDSAGQPDVLRESSQHVQWRSMTPSQRLSVKEPPFYEPAYYTHPFAGRGRLSSLSVRDPSLPASAPNDARQAYAFWKSRDPAVAKRIAQYYIAAEREKEDALRPQGPDNGTIQQTLLSSIDAAQAWLAKPT